VYIVGLVTHYVLGSNIVAKITGVLVRKGNDECLATQVRVPHNGEGFNRRIEVVLSCAMRDFTIIVALAGASHNWLNITFHKCFHESLRLLFVFVKNHSAEEMRLSAIWMNL
ncbi:hypothetical protein, partial [Methylothermus subterraneus]